MDFGDSVKSHLGSRNRDPISMREAFRFAWPTYKKRVGLFAAILLTILGAWVALELVVIAGQRFGILLWLVAHLAFLVFVAGVKAGFLAICLDLYDGQEPAFADTFKALALGPKFLAGQIVYVLMVAAGLLLLVVPGVYLGVRYAFFSLCMVDGDRDLVRSFQESAILSSGMETSLLKILVVLLVLNVLGASLLGLGLFVTVPLSFLMLTAVYRQLSTR
jgi:uncharacterized membrane protein